MLAVHPCIITVAPNGARRTKADHPALPLTPDELAATSVACADAGASILHLHVRDREGRHILDAEAYRTAITAIRRSVGDRLVIQVTTEAVGRYTPEQQIAVVRALKPEAVSVAIRELVPDDSYVTQARDFLEWLVSEGIHVQYIVYSSEDLSRFNALRRSGVVPDRSAFLLFVLGRYTPNQISRPSDLLDFLKVVEESDHWGVCAFGPFEAACTLTAAAFGGHIRVGFENNMLLSNGSLASDNAELVRQAVAGLSMISRQLADIPATKTLLEIC